MIGQVYKVQTDTFVVKSEDKIVLCNSRGLIKKCGDGVLVGDIVTVENGVITKVHQRKNRFIRPSVCNVDLIVVLISPEPKPDFYLVDKVLVNAIKENVDVLFVVNKTDFDDSLYQQVVDEYKHLEIDIVKISAKTKAGVEELKQRLKGKLSVFVGQSAVGKTSLVNSMFDLDLKTGELSGIGRGKHTTTRSEIFENQDIKVVDSPGFAVIDAEVTAEEFPLYYEEYFEVSNDCRFRGCRHIDEPNCKVKELVEKGFFSKSRYDRYVEIYLELQKRRKIYERN